MEGKRITEVPTAELKIEKEKKNLRHYSWKSDFYSKNEDVTVCIKYHLNNYRFSNK